MLTTLTAIVTTTHRALQGIIASTTLEILSAGHVLYNRGNMNDKSMPVQVGRYMAALSARPKHRDATLLPAHVELSRHLRATGAPVEMLTHMPSFLWTQERSKKARDCVVMTWVEVEEAEGGNTEPGATGIVRCPWFGVVVHFLDAPTPGLASEHGDWHNIARVRWYEFAKVGRPPLYLLHVLLQPQHVTTRHREHHTVAAAGS